MKKRILAAALALSLLLCSCGVLERSYSSVEMHSETYWENEAEDTLRAENYQDLVNALLLLVGDHVSEGVVRVYGVEEVEWEGMAERACNEVQQETATGAYLLDYITYTLDEEGEYRALKVSFHYRRSAAEYAAMINATSVEAVPDLLRTAVEEGANALTVRFGYFGVTEQAFADMVETVRQELRTETVWEISFYPSFETVGIVEILLI